MKVAHVASCDQFEKGKEIRPRYPSGVLAGPLGNLSLFYAWAGAVMERDLATKRKPEDLARIHRWTMKWKKRSTCLQE